MLLAGSRLAQEDAVPVEAEWCNSAELEETFFQGRSFRLQWWDANAEGDRGDRRFGIDFDDTERPT
jgi:hypothetical protein